MELEGIDHVALGVRDIERSVKWYIEVLGFERLHEGVWDGVPTFIGKGNTGIALFPANPTAKSTSSSHRAIRMLHLAFRADRENFLAAQRELEKRGIKFEFQDHEISHSIYFRDPDGHALEITTYEVPKPSRLVMSSGGACQAAASCEGWRHLSLFQNS
jgi:catechol 2,3-dioxygenase-like lactoylglutathione lyase family enzyme